MKSLADRLRKIFPHESTIDIDRHAELVAQAVEASRKESPMTTFTLPENTILLATVGSSAHGLALEGTDDHDEMGICIEDAHHVIGLKRFEQTIQRSQPEGVRSQHGDTDRVIYSARKFCRLALGGNPSIITALYAPDMACTEAGQELVANAGWFSSRSAGRAFLGYMTQQRQRLTGERGQMNVKRPELVEAHGYDTKYAMHMLRLGYQGVEFLSTGGLSLPMPEEEREFIMRVRRGEVDLNVALTRAGEIEQELEDLLENSWLPPKANSDAVQDWLVATYARIWEQGESVG